MPSLLADTGRPVGIGGGSTSLRWLIMALPGAETIGSVWSGIVRCGYGAGDSGLRPKSCRGVPSCLTESSTMVGYCWCSRTMLYGKADWMALGRGCARM